jgi:hypothetical protein
MYFLCLVFICNQSLVVENQRNCMKIKLCCNSKMGRPGGSTPRRKRTRGQNMSAGRRKRTLPTTFGRPKCVAPLEMPLGLLRRSTSSLPLVLDTTFQLVFTGMNVVGALHLLDRLAHCSYAASSACSIAASDYLRRPCGDQATYVLPPTAWSPPVHAWSSSRRRVYSSPTFIAVCEQVLVFS